MYLFETYNDFKTIICRWLIVLLIIFSGTSLVLAADEIDLKPQHVEVEKNSIYELFFSIEKEISPKAIVTIEFPTNFDLSGVLIAGSATINGGFSLSVEQNKVVIKRSGLGRTIKPNEKVDIKFANVRNPATAADDYRIKINIKNDENITIIDKENNLKIVSNK